MEQNWVRTQKRVKYIARRRLVTVPEDVGFNYIQTSFFCLLNQIFPHLRGNFPKNIRNITKSKLQQAKNYEKLEEEEVTYIGGTSGIMYGTREEDSPLPIDNEGLSVIGHTRLNHLRTQTQSQAKCKEQFGNRASFHVLPRTQLAFSSQGAGKIKSNAEKRSERRTMEVQSMILVFQECGEDETVTAGAFLVRGTTTLPALRL